VPLLRLLTAGSGTKRRIAATANSAAIGANRTFAPAVARLAGTFLAQPETLATKSAVMHNAVFPPRYVRVQCLD